MDSQWCCCHCMSLCPVNLGNEVEQLSTSQVALWWEKRKRRRRVQQQSRQRQWQDGNARESRTTHCILLLVSYSQQATSDMPPNNVHEQTSWLLRALCFLTSGWLATHLLAMSSPALARSATTQHHFKHSIFCCPLFHNDHLLTVVLCTTVDYSLLCVVHTQGQTHWQKKMLCSVCTLAIFVPSWHWCCHSLIEMPSWLQLAEWWCPACFSTFWCCSCFLEVQQQQHQPAMSVAFFFPQHCLKFETLALSR